MESLFNLVWVLASTVGICFWLKRGSNSQRGKQSSLVGLAMLVVILFPVISVSDDLWSSQNLAETDSCQRRDQSGGTPHTQFPAAAALPEPIYAARSFGFLILDVPQFVGQNTATNPALGFIENRPPPVF